MSSPYKNIYVALGDDSTIKIGISQHPQKRKKELERASGKTIVRFHITEQTINARKIEELTHNKFQLHRKKGEWFSSNVSFDEVVLHLRFYDYSDDPYIY